jgi:hypothetical protein
MLADCQGECKSTGGTGGTPGGAAFILALAYFEVQGKVSFGKCGCLSCGYGRV